MKTANFGRGVIEGTCGSVPFSPGPDDWLITITNANGNDASVECDFGRILYMQFNDTTTVGQGEITDAQATAIAAFIKEARDLQKNVWANCHAGICRSGAIVSLLVDLGWELADSDMSPGRIPNHLVYDKVRRHFPELRQSWDKPETAAPDSGADPSIWVAAKWW